MMVGERVANALAHAQALAELGVDCFPCNDDKTPTTPHGFLNATRDPALLNKMWSVCPGSLVGIATGAISGIDVLDVDLRHPEATQWWAENKPRLPVTWTNQTRSGGLHLVFRHGDGRRNSQGRIAMGIDVRAYGGYAIWWPAAGFEILCDEPPTLWPQWVVDALQRSPAVTPGVSRARVPEARSLAGLVRRVATAREGERNCLTFWAGCRAGEMVGSGMLDVGAAIAVIAEAATRAGLPRDEAERTAASGVRTGLGASHDW